jgi:hydroxymethylpyrimidine pyrophosphatase-like HAD family hydrolase
MKRQTIAFDLDGTLVPECGEFSCVRTACRLHHAAYKAQMA